MLNLDILIKLIFADATKKHLKPNEINKKKIKERVLKLFFNLCENILELQKLTSARCTLQMFYILNLSLSRALIGQLFTH